MDWHKLIKRYVWDDEKTPYFVPVDKLNRSQAGYEVFAYAVFIAVLFAVVAVVSLSENAPYGKSLLLSGYAFSIMGSVLILNASKTYYAAVYCATAPAMVLLYFLIKGFHPNLGLLDKVLLVGFALLWLRYSLRIMAIAKSYGELPAAKKQPFDRR